jgi:hypothetical protein
MSSIRRYLSLGVGAVLVGLAAGYVMLRLTPENGYAGSTLPQPLRDWQQPELVIVATGQMHGYIGPCGCSHPQYGGLARRYNFVEQLKKKGWKVIGLDLGELPQTSGIKEQALHKLELSMKALNLMDYRAVGIGRDELNMPLTDLLAAYSLNQPKPRPLAVNLADAADPNLIYHNLGQDLKERYKNEKFLDTRKALKDALEDFATGQVELGIAMYHEYPEAPKNVVNPVKWVEDERLKRAANFVDFCAAERKQNQRMPPIGLVMSLTDEPEPPGQLLSVPGSTAKLLEIGHKGRYVGVVGIFRKGAEFELKYQLVSMDPDYEVPAQNPVVELMEQYAKQVAKENLLAKAPRTPHHTQIDPALVKAGVKSRYVGSEVCQGCHKHAWDIWDKSGHSHAIDALVKAVHPANRQFDPECVVCHTVGFRHPTGYYDPPGKEGLNAQQAKALADKHNEKLLNVGCENCHGPCSAHVNNPDDTSLYPLINPYRATEAERSAERDAANPALAPAQKQEAQKLKLRRERERMLRLDEFCQRCHDTDNDVKWAKVPFAEKWIGGRIVHTTPRPGQRVEQAQPKQALPVLPTSQKK